MSKFKIQTAVREGWADMKVSDDGLHYVDDHYDDKAEAESEMASIVKATEAVGGEYRVVPVDTPQDMDIYA